MTKEDLLEWIQCNMWEYNSLNSFTSEIICGTEFLILPVGYGAYSGGLYLCFQFNETAAEKRKQNCAVGVIEDYDTARDLLLEWAMLIKKQ